MSHEEPLQLAKPTLGQRHNYSADHTGILGRGLEGETDRADAPFGRCSKEKSLMEMSDCVKYIEFRQWFVTSVASWCACCVCGYGGMALCMLVATALWIFSADWKSDYEEKYNTCKTHQICSLIQYFSFSTTHIFTQDWTIWPQNNTVFF